MALSLPDPTFDAESTRRLYPTLPLFEGFPYLVTRVVPAMYHVIPLPAAASTAERQARQRRLDALVEAHRRKGGYILGDPTKGGREATADEVGRLAGAGPEGRPRGLERCPACGEWRGRCLDPSPTFVGKVMAVHIAAARTTIAARRAASPSTRASSMRTTTTLAMARSGTCPASRASAIGVPTGSGTATMCMHGRPDEHHPS
jgi:hypothetical protein